MCNRYSVVLEFHDNHWDTVEFCNRLDNWLIFTLCYCVDKYIRLANCYGVVLELFYNHWNAV